MPRVELAVWTPRGVESLEPAAEQVVRSDANCLVTAGPGAGKTELLAQRACFLLETGLCAPPHRILAISFKRDAATNLQQRVEKRCSSGARRFESSTLDAFAKGLVDRFRGSLPADWRPTLGYEPLLKTPRTAEMREWLLSVIPPNLQTRYCVVGLLDLLQRPGIAAGLWVIALRARFVSRLDFFGRGALRNAQYLIRVHQFAPCTRRTNANLHAMNTTSYRNS